MKSLNGKPSSPVNRCQFSSKYPTPCGVANHILPTASIVTALASCKAQLLFALKGSTCTHPSFGVRSLNNAESVATYE